MPHLEVLHGDDCGLRVDYPLFVIDDADLLRICLRVKREPFGIVDALCAAEDVLSDFRMGGICVRLPAAEIIPRRVQDRLRELVALVRPEDYTTPYEGLPDLHVHHILPPDEEYVLSVTILGIHLLIVILPSWRTPQVVSDVSTGGCEYESCLDPESIRPEHFVALLRLRDRQHPSLESTGSNRLSLSPAQ